MQTYADNGDAIEQKMRPVNGPNIKGHYQVSEGILRWSDLHGANVSSWTGAYS